MKKIFALILFACGIVTAQAQVTGLELPYGIKVLDSLATDAWYGPYPNIDSALSHVPSAVRKNRTVKIDTLEYWWRDGSEDEDLVVKTVTGIDLKAGNGLEVVDGDSVVFTGGDIYLPYPTTFHPDGGNVINFGTSGQRFSEVNQYFGNESGTNLSELTSQNFKIINASNSFTSRNAQSIIASTGIQTYVNGPGFEQGFVSYRGFLGDTRAMQWRFRWPNNDNWDQFYINFGDMGSQSSAQKGFSIHYNSNDASSFVNVGSSPSGNDALFVVNNYNVPGNLWIRPQVSAEDATSKLLLRGLSNSLGNIRPVEEAGIGTGLTISSGDLVFDNSSLNFVSLTQMMDSINNAIDTLSAGGGSSGWNVTGTTTLTGDVSVESDHVIAFKHGEDVSIILDETGEETDEILGIKIKAPQFIVSTTAGGIATEDGTTGFFFDSSDGNLASMSAGGTALEINSSGSVNIIGGVLLGYETTTNVNNRFDALVWKNPVTVASTEDIALSGETPLTIDGVVVTTVSGTRVLLKDQADKKENGIYSALVTGETYALNRIASHHLPNVILAVNEGDVNSGKVFRLSEPKTTITLGTDDIEFTEFGAGGGGGVEIAEVMDSIANAIDSLVSITQIEAMLDTLDTGGSPDWGDIGGTLSDQTDLKNALDAKADLAGATFSGKVNLTADATNPGLNIGSYSGDPSGRVSNDLWYNSNNSRLSFRHGSQDRTIITGLGSDIVANRIPLIAATDGRITSTANLTFTSNTLNSPNISVSTGATLPAATLIGTDPAEDAILYWDDSDSQTKYLGIGSGLEISGGDLVATGGGGGSSITFGDPGTVPLVNSGEDDFDYTAYTLPLTDGTNGQALITNGSGVVTWTTLGGGSGTVTSVGMSVPTGFAISGTPVTTSGTLALSFDTGYQGYTTDEASKLSGIEAGADVTDATNVAGAGAIMDGDFSSNGMMARTASGTYASRTITGTADRISISNGTGASGNPTIDIASTYVGQNTITTLGTIGTGVWNATDIPLSAGGTGASLSDPGADRIMFWDDSDGAVEWLEVGSGLSLTGNTLTSTSITNTAEAGELMRSDGTNAVPSGIFANTAGDMLLGPATGGGITRTIEANGSSISVGVRLLAKGSGTNILEGSINSLISSSTNNARTVNTDNDGVANALTIHHQLSSGTPSAGIGGGIAFLTQTGSPNNEIGSVIESVSTDVTSASEDFDLVFKNMAAGSAASEVFRLTSAGNATLVGTGTGTDWVATSDRRLKENIRPAGDQLIKIGRISNLVKTYDRKDNGKTETGFVAQELLEVAPEYVNVPEDTAAMMSVNYAKMVVPLYKGVDELNNEVDQLRREVAELKAIIRELQK